MNYYLFLIICTVSCTQNNYTQKLDNNVHDVTNTINANSPDSDIEILEESIVIRYSKADSDTAIHSQPPVCSKKRKQATKQKKVNKKRKIAGKNLRQEANEVTRENEKRESVIKFAHKLDAQNEEAKPMEQQNTYSIHLDHFYTQNMLQCVLLKQKKSQSQVYYGVKEFDDAYKNYEEKMISMIQNDVLPLYQNINVNIDHITHVRKFDEKTRRTFDAPPLVAVEDEIQELEVTTRYKQNAKNYDVACDDTNKMTARKHAKAYKSHYDRNIVIDLDTLSFVNNRNMLLRNASIDMLDITNLTQDAIQDNNFCLENFVSIVSRQDNCFITEGYDMVRSVFLSVMTDQSTFVLRHFPQNYFLEQYLKIDANFYVDNPYILTYHYIYFLHLFDTIMKIDIDAHNERVETVIYIHQKNLLHTQKQSKKDDKQSDKIAKKAMQCNENRFAIQKMYAYLIYPFVDNAVFKQYILLHYADKRMCEKMQQKEIDGVKSIFIYKTKYFCSTLQKILYLVCTVDILAYKKTFVYALDCKPLFIDSLDANAIYKSQVVQKLLKSKRIVKAMMICEVAFTKLQKLQKLKNAEIEKWLAIASEYKQKKVIYYFLQNNEKEEANDIKKELQKCLYTFFDILENIQLK